MRRFGSLIFVGLVLALCVDASAAPAHRVEVVDVSGIIDGNVERAITRAFAEAEQEHAALVVLQVNSNGVIGAGRTERLAKTIGRSRIPVAAWIGPAGARARNGAAAIWYAAHYSAMAPATTVGPVETFDLRARPSRRELRGEIERLSEIDTVLPDLMTADVAKHGQHAHFVVGSLGDVLTSLNGKHVRSAYLDAKLSIDPRRDVIRLHKLDLIGRALHAAAQPSIVYLLVLLGLVGLLFEAFHPSTGPAGITGAVAMALAVYGLVVLGGSWLGFALIVAGVGAFAVDLRFQSLGPFTALGFSALVAGSILLFSGPFLRVPPWLIAGGVAAMTAFLLGAMTRVLRDLRLVASGHLEVRDAHEAVTGPDNGHGGTDGR